MREAARGTTDGGFLRRAAMIPSRHISVPSTDGQPPWLPAANERLIAAFSRRKHQDPAPNCSPESQPVKAFAPTEEQVAIVEAAKELCAAGEGALCVKAYAGAGKTSTIKLVARDAFPGRRGLYVAFNSAIAADARNSFPPTVEVKTLHALARRALQVGGGDGGNLNARLVHQIVGEDSRAWLGGKAAPRKLSQAHWVAAALTEFCQSADAELDLRHIERALDKAVYRVPTEAPADPAAKKLHAERMDLRLAAAKLLGVLCPRVWAVLADWRRNASTPAHDVYLKMFEMDEALVAETMAAYDYLLLDEAQDLNAVMLSIAVKAERPLIAVGDSFQQIYSWRGAENALDKLPGKTLYLSQSFRFGDAIADQAWALLTSKPECGPTVRLKGNSARQSVVVRDIDGGIENGTVVARTNVGVLKAAAEVARSGRTVNVVGGIEVLAKDLRSALALYENRKRDVVVESLRRFESWDDLRCEAEDADDVALQRLVDAIEKGDALRDLAAIEKMYVADEKAAAVVVTTVHKSKGREWGTVTMWDDFPPGAKLMTRYRLALKQEDDRLRSEMIKAVLEEWHVAYVGMTRAVDRLVVRG